MSTSTGQIAPDPIDQPERPTEGQVSDQAPPSRGKPSPFMTAAMEDAGVLDTSPGYESATDGAPERGIFHIVGGYLDDAGEVHTEVELRAISGEEEDLLGNRAVPVIERFNTILASCTKRIGTIVDTAQVRLAINRLPGGSRIHLLICLRRTSHWLKTKDMYDMSIDCPKCEVENSYTLDLGKLDRYEMENPKTRTFDVTLPYTKQEAVWRVATAQQEHVMGMVADTNESEYLTAMIVVRMVSVDDEDLRLTMADLLTEDRKQLRLSPKGKVAWAWAKKLQSGDRDELREQFMRHEPGVDVDLNFKCKSPKCGKSFKSKLDVAQEAFFFPSATYRRSKQKSST